MGTHAYITFKDNSGRQFRLFQHYDGHQCGWMAAAAYEFGSLSFAGEAVASYVSANKTGAGNIYVVDSTDNCPVDFEWIIECGPQPRITGIDCETGKKTWDGLCVKTVAEMRKDDADAA